MSKSKVLRDIYYALLERDYYDYVASEMIEEAILTACKEMRLLPIEANGETVDKIDEYIQNNLI